MFSCPAEWRPSAGTLLKIRLPAVKGGLFKKFFFFVYISSAPKALELTQLLIYAVTYGKTNTEEVGSNLGACIVCHLVL